MGWGCRSSPLFHWRSPGFWVTWGTTFIFVKNVFHEMNTARSLNIGCPGLFEFRSMHFSNDLNCSFNFCIAVPSQNIWLQRCHTFHVDSKGVWSGQGNKRKWKVSHSKKLEPIFQQCHLKHVWLTPGQDGWHCLLFLMINTHSWW